MKISLRKIHISRDGYRNANSKYPEYYGVGAPVYEWEVEDYRGVPRYLQHGSLRAYDREEAKAIVREMHPNARFYR